MIVASKTHPFDTHQHGAWQIDHQIVSYDVSAYLEKLAQSDFLLEAGSMGWLYFAEICSTQRHRIPFLTEFCSAEISSTYELLEDQVIAYLKSIRRWGMIRPYLCR